MAEIEQLKDYPSEEEADEISSALSKPKEWLFPPELIRFRLIRRMSILSLEQVTNLQWIKPRELPAPDCPDEFRSGEIEKVLSTLEEKEVKVLKLRFGLEDGRARTLEEVGKKFGVTGERIRQIEYKAMRRLRHPSRCRRLKEFINEYE